MIFHELEPITGRLFAVDKFRWREQFRGIGIVPQREFVGVETDIVYNVGETARVECFAPQVAEDLRLNGGDEPLLMNSRITTEIALTQLCH